MPEQWHDQVVHDRHEELVWYRRGVTQETLDQHGRAKISHQRADRAQRYLAPVGSARQYQPEDVEPRRKTRSFTSRIIGPSRSISASSSAPRVRPEN